MSRLSTKSLTDPTPVDNATSNGKPATATESKPRSLFSVENLKLDTNPATVAGVGERVFLTLPAKKPSNQTWFHASPDPEFSVTTKVLVVKDSEDAGFYLIAPDLWPAIDLKGWLKRMLLIACVDSHGEPFIFPCRLPGDEARRKDDWSRSTLKAIELAKTRLVRMTANMRRSCYDVDVAADDVPLPAFPKLTFQEMIDLAFEETQIVDADHPVLRSLLRGEK